MPNLKMSSIIIDDISIHSTANMFSLERNLQMPKSENCRCFALAKLGGTSV